ncbi:threonine/serine ThrE exporter family protein [Vibrio ostreicida]|uniref:Threonine/serine exporter ThrE family protein n=1 Tax=Vibrio ostreicida TaxID=526588 RepID=A0ABT8BSC2_9VIBR|nr:threonine/serine exporter ThrE family protein [Vibrio ostreicida]MDN3609010.1 threonine/serine exporter ThrE family protein [Vibrio ostreicida]NPD07908.1 threonine/serine exporter ThrE family protein [Vibrio ostreicida]
MVDQQRRVSRLIAQAGQLLLAHGAESTLVTDLTQRIGLASGMDSVDVSLSARSLVITTIYHTHCITTVRCCLDRGINMQVVTRVQRICILLERGIFDVDLAQKQLDQVHPQHYNRWLVAFMIGLSCAAFGGLAGGNELVVIMTFIASVVGITVRQELSLRHFNPLINFSVTAFFTTLISAQAVIHDLGNAPFLVMASSVLMLVPGFPLINAVSDMLKGEINMGVTRFVMASLLTLATCLGIVAAMSVTGVRGWVL